MIDLKALSAPFDPQEVSWRVGSMTKDKDKGMALAYVDARVVMDRLDAVCGPAGWQCRYSHANGKTVCDIAVKCGDEWIWKADGAGDSDIEAEKGALSDAFKRAAVRWGIGRYLYELPSPWVEVDQWKKIKAAEYKKLDQTIRQHTQRILNPPTATESGATAALQSAKDDIAQMANEASFLKKATLTAVSMSPDRASLKNWWEESRADLKAKLPASDFAEIMDAVIAKRDSLPAMAA